MAPKDWKERRFGKATSDQSKGYKVGYGCPPKHTQYPKGVSGNPRGRPQGATRLKRLIYEFGDEFVTLATKDGEKSVPLKEAAVRKFWEALIKGDYKFFKEYFVIEEQEQRIDLEKDAQKETDNLKELQRLLPLIVDPDRKDEFIARFDKLSARNRRR